MSNQKETVAEFLARGGKITVVPPTVRNVDEEAKHTVKSTSKHVRPELHTLGNANAMFGEVRKNKPRAKKPKKEDLTKVDMSLLPAHIQALCVVV